MWGIGEIAQQVKGLNNWPDNLSLITRTDMVRERASMKTYTHTHTQYAKKKNLVSKIQLYLMELEVKISTEVWEGIHFIT